VSSVREIAVRDGNGDQLTVFEFRDRRFIRKVKRWKLDNGETVEAIDADTFQLACGERLTLVP
jgi:hypothetical protein